MRKTRQVNQSPSNPPQAASAAEESPALHLPQGWGTAEPFGVDVADLAVLLRRHQEAARGWASASLEDVETEVVGAGMEPRQHLMVRDTDDAARAWASVYDRAAGRTMVAVTVDPDLDAPTADDVAAQLFRWCAREARAVMADRGLDHTQLDSGSFAGDERQQRWLADAGYQRVRRWWQMRRPVDPSEGEPGVLAEPRPGVEVRRVRRGPEGMPDVDDLHAVHDILEESFADHFNSHRETFQEFVMRVRTDPGHRWDHWWLAELVDEGPTPVPVGALVGSMLRGGFSPDGQPRHAGSYVDYLGVLGTARGRGVAKSLLRAIIADAARRGRDRVGLEVDADSPTGADALYTSMGFETAYVTESWHCDLPAEPRP